MFVQLSWQRHKRGEGHDHLDSSGQLLQVVRRRRRTGEGRQRLRGRDVEEGRSACTEEDPPLLRQENPTKLVHGLASLSRQTEVPKMWSLVVGDETRALPPAQASSFPGAPSSLARQRSSACVRITEFKLLSVFGITFFDFFLTRASCRVGRGLRWCSLHAGRRQDEKARDHGEWRIRLHSGRI